jgi:hypothetical protein
MRPIPVADREGHTVHDPDEAFGEGERRGCVHPGIKAQHVDLGKEHAPLTVVKSTLFERYVRLERVASLVAMTG